MSILYTKNYYFFHTIAGNQFVLLLISADSFIPTSVFLLQSMPNETMIKSDVLATMQVSGFSQIYCLSNCSVWQI